MLNESKILINNISNFRQLLTEATTDNRIVDAINNYKYIYIYYEGDDTVQKGYRTIRPFRLGALKSNTENNGQLALRAWQDKGTSDSFKWGDKAGRRRSQHEYWDNVPGWRLFLVNNITEVLPTGLKFVDDNGKVIIPPKYKETDEQIPTAIAMISISQPQVMQTKGIDSLAEPDVIAQKVDKSAFAPQAKRFKDFYNVQAKNKRITKDTLQSLYDMIKRVRHKSPNNYLVVIDKSGNFRTINVTQKDKIPQDIIVGNLMSLYAKMVQPPVAQSTEMKNFVEKTKNELIKNTGAKENIEKNPIERKTFFK